MIIVAFFLAALARICLRPSRSPDAGVCLGVRVGVGVVGDGDGDVGAAGGSQAALRHMCWAVTLSAGIVATAGSHCCKKKTKKAQKTERIIVLKGHVSLKFDVGSTFDSVERKLTHTTDTNFRPCLIAHLFTPNS